MLGLDNPIHIAFVLVLLLLVFGAKRLPEMGKSLGAGLRGFKESISGEDQPAHLTSAYAPVRVDEHQPTAPVASAVPTAAPAPAAVPVIEPLAAPAPEPVAEHAPMHSVA